MTTKQHRYRVIKLLSGVLLLALIFSSFNNASAGQNGVPAYDITGTLTDTPIATATTFGAYFFDPVGPYCVGGGCSGPTGYNLVTSSTLNEQSMAASDTKSGFSTGRGRVETTIRVGGAGIGTVRVYVQWGAISCSEGASILIYKLSGNEEYPGIPGGYMDIALTYGDHGEFKILTRCMTAGRYVGPIGIDGIQYSLLPLATSTPTTTNTPTATGTSWVSTPTETLTPTITSTPTITFIPTLTFTATNSPTSIPPTSPPNYGGSGACWESGESWEVYTVSYTIDRNTIPLSFGWDSSLNGAAQVWNNVVPSHFEFVYSANSNNVISYGTTQDANAAAETGPVLLFSWMKITEKWTVINSNFIWDTNNTPIPNDPNSNGSTTTLNVQNVMTHEFGHWLRLKHSSCISSTMYPSTYYGRIDWITLDSSDEDAINWQYP